MNQIINLTNQATTYLYTMYSVDYRRFIEHCIFIKKQETDVDFISHLTENTIKPTMVIKPMVVITYNQFIFRLPKNLIKVKKDFHPSHVSGEGVIGQQR